ncbi:MAG: glycosyltransferase family 2 protein [Prevotella sp.]|nr:glycosyltransferase family 2 protein [Prevotella sp.]
MMNIRKTIGKLFPSKAYKYLFNSFGYHFYKIDKRPIHLKESKACSPELERCGMMLVTIAYNDENLIAKQIEMVRKHVKDPNYQLIIIDNSPNKTKRKKIQTICKECQIEYIPVPYSFRQKFCKFFRWGGMSHGLALNWAFYHVLCQKNPKRIALLDHDIFPIKDCNLTERLGGLDFFGVPRKRDKYWYLWPGWSLFNFDAIVDRYPNFQPYSTKTTYLDSGGGNYFKIYHNYAINTIPFPSVKTHRLKKTKGFSTWNDVYHSDCIQFIDECWLHVINGSNYCHLAGKDNTIRKIVDNINLFEE